MNETNNKYIDKLTDVAEGQGWTVQVDGNEKGGRVSFHKSAPSGYPFFFEVDLPESDTIAGDLTDVVKLGLKDKADYLQAYGLVNNVYDSWFDFDARFETSIRVDENGHGMNGAPYDYSDVLADMKACESNMDKLHRVLHNAIEKEDPSKYKNSIER